MTIVDLDKNTDNGTIPKINRYINLTSVTNPVVNLLLAKHPNIPSKIKYLPFNSNVVYDDKHCKPFNLRDKYTNVVLVYDEDDKNINIRIRQLATFQKIRVVYKIMIKNIDIKQPRNKKLGVETRVCNMHNNLDVIKSTNAKPLTLEVLKGTNIVKIVKTKGANTAHIAAIKLTALLMQLTIEFETVYISNVFTWLDRKLDLTNIEYDKTQNTGKVMENERFWNRQTGHSNKLLTTAGCKAIKMKDKKKTNKNWTIIEIIKKIVAWVYNKIIILINSFKTKKTK